MPSDEAQRHRDALEDAERRWPDALAGQGRNNAHLVLKNLDDLVHDRRILDPVGDLIGKDIIAYATVLFIKEPETPGFVSWHQDGTYMGLQPMTGVSVWLALSPSNLDTGCMKMIPGSHKSGILPHDDTYGETNILTRGQQVAGVNENTAVDLILKPGQMSLHSMLVVHGSEPNLSTERRIGFVIQPYQSPDVHQKLTMPYGQLVRGSDTAENYLDTPRASGNMIAADVKRWQHANNIYADTLYHGAKKRRDF